MSFDILGTFKARLGENYKLHAKYVNPAWAKVSQLTGYDKVYAKAEGCHLWDQDGRRYLDCVSGFCVSNIGHNHPVVRKALQDALSESLPNLLQLDCSLLSGLMAEALIRRIPWLDMVYFGNSGSEAIETCLKFARAASGKRRLLYADHSYHGVSFGALSVTGHKMWRDGFEPLLPMTDMVPFGDVEAVAREMAKGDVAGILLEPVQVGAGIILPPEGYHKAVQDLCRKHKAYFIMDEIHTGFGRTGTFLASERLGVEPDLVALSKGMSGALVPVSAVVTRKEVIKGVYSRLDRSCVHASTFMGNNLAMIAGLATLHVLESEKLIEKGRERGEALLAALKPFVGKYELVKEVRGLGLLIGVEFGEPKSFMLRKAWSWMHKINPGLFAQAFTIPLMEKHGIMTQVAGHNEDVLKIAPALVLTAEDADFLVKSLEEVIATSHSFPGPFWEVGSRLAKNAIF